MLNFDFVLRKNWRKNVDSESEIVVVGTNCYGIVVVVDLWRCKNLMTSG